MARRGVHISSRRSLVIPPCCPISLISSTDQAEDFAKDVDDLIAARQGGIALVVTDTLYPAIRNTHGAAQLEAVRAALARHPDPKIALWRARRGRAARASSRPQEKPSRQWLREDGALGLGDGDEIPVTMLAAEMARSVGIDHATARRVVAWLPDAVRQVPTLFRGLAAVPTTTDDGQPTMAQRVVGATRAATTRPWPRRRHHDINAL